MDERNPRSSDVWPTESQEWLLRACLLEGEAAMSAWKEWRRGVDLEAEFDRGTFRLLPLAYARLTELGVDDPLMPRLKGIYRRCWYQNQQLFHDIALPLRRLEESGVETLVLKGVPLVASYYATPGLRPMADLDVAVRPEQAQAAAGVLSEVGFHSPRRISPGSLAYRHSFDFRNAEDREVDLHWHVFFESCATDGDDEFWNHSVPIEFQGIPTRALCTTDMLLHVIVHGIKWNPEPPIRWIADAATVLRVAGEDVDWERFTRMTESLHIALRVREGIDYLHDVIGLRIPAPVRASLAALPVTRMERAEHAIRLRDRDRVAQQPLGLARLLLIDYWRLCTGDGPLRAALGLPAYLAFRWRLKGAALKLLRRAQSLGVRSVESGERPS